MKKILCVEDESLVGTGMILMLQSKLGKKDFEFLLRGSCAGAIAYDDKDSIDLLLLDLGLPGVSGIDAIRQIKQHFRCKVVVVSSNDTKSMITKAIDNGAAGFISKRSDPKDYVAAVKFHIESSPDSKGLVIDGPGGLAKENESRRDEIHKSLTPKEFEVFIRLACTETNKKIGEALHMSDGTVKAHLSACYRKLGLKDRREAIALVTKLDLSSKSD